MYNSIKNVVKERLASDDHLSGSTTFDIWTDKHAKKSYIGLTYHYIDADYKLCKVLLAANVFPHPHNYSAIGLKLSFLYSHNLTLLSYVFFLMR